VINKSRDPLPEAEQWKDAKNKLAGIEP